MAQPRPWTARRSPRLTGYDLARPALYFVTVCAHNREPLLGAILDGDIRPSPAGLATADARNTLPLRFPTLALDAFTLMPNHLHAILHLGTAPDAPVDTAPPTLPAVLRAFKSVSAIETNRARGTPGAPLWQRSYHDHTIRTDRALQNIRHYIASNPANWPTDPDNPTLAQLPHTR